MKRLIDDQRGLIRTVEAFFAVVLLLSATAFFAQTQGSLKDESESLYSTAYSTLLNLDYNGKIGSLIESESWSQLRELLQDTLPSAVWFNLTAFDKNMVQLNELPVCTGSSVSNQVTSIEYVCAGINGQYSVYLVRLQVAVVD